MIEAMYSSVHRKHVVNESVGSFYRNVVNFSTKTKPISFDSVECQELISFLEPVKNELNTHNFEFRAEFDYDTLISDKISICMKVDAAQILNRGFMSVLENEESKSEEEPILAVVDEYGLEFTSVIH